MRLRMTKDMCQTCGALGTEVHRVYDRRHERRIRRDLTDVVRKYELITKTNVNATLQLLCPVAAERGEALSAAVGATIRGFLTIPKSGEGCCTGIKDRSRLLVRSEESRVSVLLAVGRWFSWTPVVVTCRGTSIVGPFLFIIDAQRIIERES